MLASRRGEPSDRQHVAGEHPNLGHDLTCAWLGWAARRGVVPRERILELVRWGVRGPLPRPRAERSVGRTP
jgi:hypothetical protein